MIRLSRALSAAEVPEPTCMRPPFIRTAVTAGIPGLASATDDSTTLPPQARTSPLKVPILSTVVLAGPIKDKAPAVFALSEAVADAPLPPPPVNTTVGTPV